jgi:hypothetical protein
LVVLRRDSEQETSQQWRRYTSMNQCRTIFGACRLQTECGGAFRMLLFLAAGSIISYYSRDVSSIQGEL